MKQELQIKANNILHYLDNWLCSKSLHIVLCHTATDRFSLSFWNLPLPLYVCTFQLLKGPTSKSGLARAPPRRSHAPPATGTTAGYGFSFLRPVDLSAAHFYKAFPCQMCFCHRFHSCGIGSPSKNRMELELSLVEQLADGQQRIFFSDDFLLGLLISAFQRPFGWVILSLLADLLFVPQWSHRPIYSRFAVNRILSPIRAFWVCFVQTFTQTFVIWLRFCPDIWTKNRRLAALHAFSFTNHIFTESIMS